MCNDVSLEFYILILTFFPSLLIFFKRRLYKSVLLMWYVGFFINFISPAIYIYYGGEYYLSYGCDSVSKYYLLGSFLCILNLFSCLILPGYFNDSKVQSVSLPLLHKSIIKKGKLAFLFFMGISLIYIIYYWNYWPFTNAIQGEIIDRPDTIKGVFKFFFSISTIFMVVIPSLLLFLYPYERNNIIRSIALLLTVFILVVGGNKGVFLYFCVFIWAFALNFRIGKSVLIMILSLICFYALMKGALIKSDEKTLDVILYLLESPLRRLFVAQGIAIPVRIEMLANGAFEGVTLENIKFLVFEEVYNYSPGSMPVIYVGDFIVKFGFLFTLLLSAPIILFIHIISFKIDQKNNLGYSWLAYFSLYIITMSGFSEANMYRFIIVITSFFILNIINKRSIMR